MEETEHTTASFDFYDIKDSDGNTIATHASITCTCDEVIGGEEFSGPTRMYAARHSAENAFTKHRRFRMMHVGLFEDLP